VPYDKKKLANHLETILRFTVHEMPEGVAPRQSIVLGGAGSRIVLQPRGLAPLHFAVGEDAIPTAFIYDDGCDALFDFVAECLRDEEVEELIGEAAIDKLLKEVVQRLANQTPPQQSTEEIVRDQILKPLRNGIGEWKVSVPIINLHLAEPISIGRVQFVKHETAYLDNISLAMNHEFGGKGPETVEQQRFAVLRVVNEVAAKATSWAVTSVRCHEAQISYTATKQIEAAVNVIRAFIHEFYPRKLRCAFGMPFDVVAAQTTFLAQNSIGSFCFQFDSRGVMAPIEIKSGLLEKLRTTYEFEALSRIAGLTPSTRNSLEQAIAVSNHWLGRSVTSLSREDSFTSCTIAIERLVILDKEDTTVERFSERLAYLISDDPASRESIHKMAKRLYNVRSRVVHAGFLGVTEEDLDELEGLAIHALVRVCKHLKIINSHEELGKWFQARKFA
jgi:hypothetical protein